MFSATIKKTGLSFTVEANRQTATFTGKYYKQRFSKNPGIFDFLNNYLAYKERTKQSLKPALIEEYVKAAYAVSSYLKIEDVNKGIDESITNVINIFDMNDIQEWLKKSPAFKTPAGIDDSFDDLIITNGLGSREQTYIVQDYLELAALAIVLKALVPLWGERLAVNSDIRPYLKELSLYQPIYKSKLWGTPPVLKLVAYINKTLEKVEQQSAEERAQMSINLGYKGVSFADKEDWLMAGILCNKLPTSTISDKVSTSNLATNIHGYINQRLTFNSDSASRIKDKRINDGGADEEDKTSVLEQYNKITSEIPPGHVVELNWYYGNVTRLRERFYPDLDQALYEDFLKGLRSAGQFEVLSTQTTIMSWSLRHAIDPRAVPYLNFEVIVPLLALAGALLWSRNHRYLALMVASVGMLPDDKLNTIGAPSVSKIGKERTDRLAAIYPYARVITTRRRKPITDEQRLLLNPIFSVIDKAVKDSSLYNWITLMRPDYIEKAVQQREAKLPNTGKIRILFADLLIDLSNTHWQQGEKEEDVK